MIRDLVDKLLFDYYMISSTREEEVFTPFPFYIDKCIIEKMFKSAEILDRLVNDIILNINSTHSKYKDYMGDFFNKEKVLNLQIPLVPAFWVRYDGFIRANGKDVFFSEFNYDKPCMQREIIMSSFMSPENDPNKNFAMDFRNEFYKIVNPLVKKQDFNIGILVDPCHYEELHLAHLYTDLLQNKNGEILIVGPKNLYVENKKLYAFDKEINVLLRQFPTEHFDEINDIDEIMKLFDNGEVIIINDPRILIGQAKSLFAYMWELVDTDIINKEQKKAIIETLPFTKIFSIKDVDRLKADKNKWVLKAIYGRYSEEVYIGELLTNEEWEETLQYVLESPRMHIIQEFCPIHKESILKANNCKYEQSHAFGNFGIYLMNGKANGIGVRWSEDYLTVDDTLWESPVGVRKCNTLSITNGTACWDKVNDRAIFEYGYTGGYTNQYKSFSTDYLKITESLAKEIETVTNYTISLIKKTCDLVNTNPNLMMNVLGIDEQLHSLIANSSSNLLTPIGRMDWVIDVKGNLKLLEFNSETPAGIIESIGLSSLIKEEGNIPLLDPNNKLKENIKKGFTKILDDMANTKEIKNIGFITHTYYEDWYNTKALFDTVKDLPYNFIIGSIYDVEVIDEKLYLYGTPLDAVYRYFPLDWFLNLESGEAILKAFNHNTLSINEPKSYIYQSKVFISLIYELIKHEFYTNTEKEFILKYIPKTTLDYKELNTNDFCIKPYFEREGNGVMFSFENMDLTSLENQNLIFQERVDIQTIDVERIGIIKKEPLPLYPIIGTYVADDKYSGIYTRAGNIITDMWAIYIPTYISEKGE